MKRFVQLLGGAAVLGAIFAVITMATGNLPTSTPASAAVDSCGYPVGTVPRPNTVFNENIIMAGFSSTATTVEAFYTDEHTMVLGQGAITPWVATYPKPGSTTIFADQAGTGTPARKALSVGDLTAVDAAGRPIYPAAFVTDQGLTAAFNPTALLDKTGDWQRHATTAGTAGANPPSFVAGTWKAYLGPNVTVGDVNDNGSWLGPVPPADTSPVALARGAETRWDFSTLVANTGIVQAGHTYRVQFMFHDGDQNKAGGDVGEACTTFFIPQGTPQVATDAGPTVALVNGSASLTDSATLTNGNTVTTAPVGTMEFKLYSDASCLTQVGSTVSTPVNGLGTYNSPSITVTAAGTYHWIANFISGNSANASTTNTPANACGRTGENVLVVAPAIRVFKNPKTQTILKGGTANWTITIKNTGDTALSNVSTTDVLAGDCAKTSAQLVNLGLAANATLAANDGAAGGLDEFSYTCSLANVQTAFTNVVVACGHPVAGPDVCDQDAATLDDRSGGVTPIEPKIQVTKLPHSQSLVSGGTATWTITITNTSTDATLTNVNTTDAAAADCAKTSADLINLGLVGATLAPGASFSYTCTKTNVTAAFDNVVVACGHPVVGPDICDNSPATLDARTGHVGIEALTSLQDFKPKDSAHASVTGTGILPLNGFVRFTLYKGLCTTPSIYSDTVAVDASGNASTTSALFLSQLIGSTSTGGTYNWQITYFGDTNGNADIVGACGTENFVVTNS